MPQPRSSSAKSTSGAKRTSGSTAKRASSSTKAASATKRASTTAKRSTASTSSRARTQAKSATDGADVRLEAAAQRVRKLNERIIEAGKDAGETTLTAYEKALKAIASSLDRGAATSDVEWVSHLLSTQAKFLRDVTDSWTKAARGMLK